MCQSIDEEHSSPGGCSLVVVHILRIDLELLVGDPKNDVPGNQPREAGYEAFIERGGALFHQHTNSAILGTLVFTRCAVHVTRLHHVNRTCSQGGAQSCSYGSGEMTRNAVTHATALQDEVLDHIVADDLCHVHYGVPRDVRNGS